MELGEIIGYGLTALGGGGIASIFNWRINKRKANAEVKTDELENLRKTMQDFYDPLVKKQNERISELESEVKTLRQERRDMELAYQKQIQVLQKQIVEITKALGIKTSERARDEKTGRYVKDEKNIMF